jgi:hypothetical protein
MNVNAKNHLSVTLKIVNKTKRNVNIKVEKKPNLVIKLFFFSDFIEVLMAIPIKIIKGVNVNHLNSLKKSGVFNAKNSIEFIKTAKIEIIFILELSSKSLSDTELIKRLNEITRNVTEL